MRKKNKLRLYPTKMSAICQRRTAQSNNFNNIVVLDRIAIPAQKMVRDFRILLCSRFLLKQPWKPCQEDLCWCTS